MLPLVYYLHTQFHGHGNGKQLQVTTIKITESKENKSIHRLDLSGSNGPGGELPSPPPQLATALYNIAAYPISVSVKRRLQTADWQTADCGLQTADCGPGVKCRLSVKCRLQTESKMQARGKMQN